MKSKIIHALLAVALAFGLWMYVITVVSPESEDTFYNVPVVLRNESVLNDKGLMVVTDETPTVTLRLKGNRSDLNDMKSSDITLIADLSKIDGAGQKQLTYSIAFPGSLSFEVLSQSPALVTLSIAEWASKEVDVNVVYTGSTPQDFIADTDSPELDYQKVTVTGPKDVVEEIAQAVIQVDLEGQNQTISQSYRYTLCNEAGEPVDAAQVQTNVTEVQLTLRIQQVKELQLMLEVIYGGGADENNTVVTIDPLTIKVAGSEKILENLTALTLGTVNVAELAENTTLTFPVSLPEGVENLSGLNEATVTIEFNGLVTKVLNVTRISAVAGSGTTVSLITKSLQITVRGSAEQIALLTENNLTARVDCTGAEPGEGKFKAQIFIDTQFDTVGAVGTYYIHATVSGGN